MGDGLALHEFWQRLRAVVYQVARAPIQVGDGHAADIQPQVVIEASSAQETWGQ